MKKKMHKKMKGKKAKKNAKPLPPVGTGERFSRLTNELAQKPVVTDPAALAASIGRKKYGPARFSRLSQKGKS